MDPMAFRCRSCGHLHSAGAAGESCHPHCCAVCGAGVAFHPRTGVKTFDSANWEVLADCDDARLKELGLTRAEVAAHDTSAVADSDPVKVGYSAKPPIVRGMKDGVVVKDKA